MAQAVALKPSSSGSGPAQITVASRRTTCAGRKPRAEQDWGARQIPTQGPAARLPRTVHQVVADTEIELVGRLEVRVTGRLHDLILAETFGEPVADRRSSQVVELAAIDSRPTSEVNGQRRKCRFVYPR